MDLSRRLKLYLLGLIIGGVLAFAFYGERLTTSAWTPKERVKLRLSSTLVHATPGAEAAMRAWPCDLEEVRAAIPAAEVRLGETERRADSMFYALDAVIDGRPGRLVVLGHRDIDRDSSATLWSLRPR